MMIAGAALVLAVVHLPPSATAQEDAAPSCEDVCFEAEELCYAICEEADDPDTCATSCQDQLDQCLEQCEKAH